MGCGAMGRSMPLGRAEREGGVSTRKTPSQSSLCRRLLKRVGSPSETDAIRGPDGTLSRNPSLGNPGAPQAAWGDDNLCSKASASFASSSGSTDRAVTVAVVCGSAAKGLGGSSCHQKASEGSATESTFSCRTTSPRSSIQSPDVEDSSWWEPPPSNSSSSTSLPQRKNEAEPISSPSKYARGRSRAAPLGGLAEPLVRAGSSTVDLQATALRPNVVDEEWLQIEKTCSDGSRTTSASVVNAGRARLSSPPKRCDSGDDCSLARSSCNSTVPDASSTDTNTVFESLATESSPEYLSASRSDPAGSDDRMGMPYNGRRGSDASDPPDSAAALAALSRAGGGKEVEDDLAFMLERPFAGLETILEEQDSDDDRPPGSPVVLRRSVSTSSFNTFQGRLNTGAWRSVCGQSGPLGDPSSLWPLRPEPLSAELARAAPCAEVPPGSPSNDVFKPAAP